MCTMKLYICKSLFRLNQNDFYSMACWLRCKGQCARCLNYSHSNTFMSPCHPQHCIAESTLHLLNWFAWGSEVTTRETSSSHFHQAL